VKRGGSGSGAEVTFGVGVGDGFGSGIELGSGVGDGVEPFFESSGLGVGSADSWDSLGLVELSESSGSGSELSGADGTTGAARVGDGVGSTTCFESGFDSVSPPPQLTMNIERTAKIRTGTKSFIGREYF